MKNTWVWVGAIVLVVVLGYFGRHQLRALFGGSPTPTAAPVVVKPSSSPVSVSNSIVMTRMDPAKGNFLTDPKGMTLYVFDKDTQGMSNCNGNCATIWPPYGPGGKVSNLPANFTVLARSDSSMQYAYKGMPLYFYQKDMKPGDILGDGIGNVWHLAKP